MHEEPPTPKAADDRGAEPPDAWEAAYPHRETLWDAQHPLLDAYRGRVPLPLGMSKVEALTCAQVSAAYRLERLARGIMRGEQFTGALAEPRRRVVDAIETTRILRAVWDAGHRSPEVQALVDRAVGCWRQCKEQGVRVYEYDRPGYDEVTTFFDALLAYASNPSVTPVVLEWDPEYHGEPPRRPEPRRTWVLEPETPAGKPPRSWQRIARRVAIVTGVLALVATVVPNERWQRPPDCDSQRAQLIADLRRPRAEELGGETRGMEALSAVYPGMENEEVEAARRATAADQIAHGAHATAVMTLMASADARMHARAKDVERYALRCEGATSRP